MYTMYTRNLIDGMYKFAKFHRFHQEFTNAGQKYYFIVNGKKVWFHFIASLLVILGSILGISIIVNEIIANATSFSSKTETELRYFFINVSVGISVLTILLIAFAIYVITVIVRVPRMKRIQKFRLTLEGGEVSICEKTLQTPENLTMHIIFNNRLLRGPLATAKLKLKPLTLSPFAEFSKVESYLSYHEKRGLAEQLSMHLKIQLTDMLSSFEPGIYKNKQNLPEKLNFTKLELSSSLKQETTSTSHSIKLPIRKKKAFAAIIFPWLLITLIYNITGITLFLITSIMNLVFILSIVLFSLVPFCTFANLVTILLLSKDKIFVTDESISLIRRYIWGKRRIFSSHLSELKDIAIIHEKESARIVFRNDKQTTLTNKNSKEVITGATMVINSFR